MQQSGICDLPLAGTLMVVTGCFPLPLLPTLLTGIARDLRFFKAFVLKPHLAIEKEADRDQGYILEGIGRSLPLPPKFDLNLDTFVNILRSSLIIHSKL